MSRVHRWLALAGLSLTLPLAALSAPEKGPPVPEKWRADPDEYARIRRSFAEFQALPAARQAQLRELDRQVREHPQGERLLKVAAGYAAWLERLPEDERAEVLAAPDGPARLQVIRRLREKQWLAQAPLAYRKRAHGLPPDRRSAQVAKWRQEERDQREEWERLQQQTKELIGAGGVLNALMENNKADLQALVENLRPRLSPKDLDRLNLAYEEWSEEKNWAEFGRVLVDISDRYPLLPGPAKGPASFAELPPEAQAFLLTHDPDAVKPEAFRGVEGRWPEYAIAVTERARKFGGLPVQLGPSRPGEFAQPVNDFIVKRLRNKLGRGSPDQKKLDAALGQWPEFPRLVMELARQTNMPVPGFSLPGPQNQWDKFRVRRAKAAFGARQD